MKIKTPALMFIVALVSALIIFVCECVNSAHHNTVVYGIGLTFTAVLCHFVVMFVSAPIVRDVFKKKINPDSRWFREKKFESQLYKKLRVRKWKRLLPTYSETQYSTKKSALEDTIISMCHSEIVHEAVAAASYLPVLFGICIGECGFFILTSVVFSFLHLPFIIAQRYNRPRVIRLYKNIRKRQD